MTRRVGDTERRPRLNPNARDVFFMRVESIVISEFSLCSWNEPSPSEPRLSGGGEREEKRRGRRTDELTVGWTIGKINDGSQLMGGSSWNCNVGGKMEGGTEYVFHL